jgi:hypothetical protein
VRYGSFSYQFAVPNGSYTVALKFAETYWNSAGRRIFNVSVNGTQVLTNFDIVASAGAPLTAVDKTFPTTVTNGTISIQFIPGSADFPAVNAISLVPSPPISSSTTTTMATASAPGQLSLSQSSFAFGNVNVGTGASQTFIVSNTGTTPIVFSSVSVSGAGFNATGASSGATLNAGQSTTLDVTFTPAASGTAAGSLVFISNAANATATIGFSGNGVQTALLAHFVVLTWTPSTSSSIVGYNVYRGANSAGPFMLLNASSGSATNYRDANVQSGQTYYYVVTSVDSSQIESTYSAPVSATIPGN